MATSPPTSGDEKVAKPAPAGKETRYVDALLLNVRSRPSSRAPIVRRLLGGAKIYVEIKGGWAKIRSGQWARVRFLSDSPTKRVTRKEAENAWKASKYKDNWKPAKKK